MRIVQGVPTEYNETKALELLKIYRERGGEESYLKVVLQIYPLLYGYCLRMGCKEIADDIFQDVWNSFRSAFDDFKYKSSFKSFMWGHFCRSHAIRDSIRRNQDSTTVVSITNLTENEYTTFSSTAENPEDEMLSNVLIDNIHEALGKGVSGCREQTHYFSVVKKMLAEGESWSNVKMYLTGIGRRNRIQHVEVYIRRILATFGGHADSWGGQYFAT